MAPHGSLCSRFRARTFVRAHGRHAIVDSTRSAPPACCADGFLSLSSRAFWRPGGWENLCRLMCHCVRHIGLDNKHGQSVEATHSFLSRWRAGTELCADKQEEPSGKKGSMGSEKRQKSFRSDLKSVVTLLFPPRFDRAASKTRRCLSTEHPAERQHERRREAASARRVLRAARSKLGGTDRIKADFRNLGEHL